jgi:hypothetical protein
MDIPPTTCHQRFRWVDATFALAKVFLLYRQKYEMKTGAKVSL